MAFEKGKSGNPGGRPKHAHDIQALARQYTAEAIAALYEALADSKTKVQAACALLDRGYGKPLQTVQSETTVRYVARVPDKAETSDQWQQQHQPDHTSH